MLRKTSATAKSKGTDNDDLPAIRAFDLRVVHVFDLGQPVFDLAVAVQASCCHGIAVVLPERYRHVDLLSARNTGIMPRQAVGCVHVVRIVHCEETGVE